jgi:tellurite resistance protein
VICLLLADRYNLSIKGGIMETVTLFEWAVGALFVGVNAYRRYNTPSSNRESTTFQNFITFFFFYLITVLTLYVFFGALFDSSPETIGALYGLMIGQMNATLPEELANLSSPMLSALFLTTLLPSLPWLSRYDKALLNKFWERGHIPNHVQKMAAAMRRAHFNVSPGQNRQLRMRCQSLSIDFETLELEKSTNIDYHWARLNVLLESMADWKQDDSGRLRGFMKEHSDEFNKLLESLESINGEFSELKSEQLEDHILSKIEKYLNKSIAEVFRDSTVFVAKATCVTELSESGRSSRISQLGFEGGSQGRDRLSSGQIAAALLAILVIFMTVSIAQELAKPVEYRRFGNVGFMTFLMLFTYGTALLIAIDLKCRAGMGYNELTRQRTWSAYFWVGIITASSWLLVTLSYRYILNMLSGDNSVTNLDDVITSLSWSYPYALQSLALAVSISWILDYHQSLGLSGRLTWQQRVFDMGIAMAALAAVSIVAFYWMEGIGWFEGYGTKDIEYRGRISLGWTVAKGVAVAAVVGWLVPMWFNLNRLKAPDQIAGRLIAMNKKGLSREIRRLEPNQLISAVAAVGASVAYLDNTVRRSEKDVYQIICSHLAGLPSSDVDVDAAEKELDSCLELIEKDELELEKKMNLLSGMPLLSALMPFIASSVAFADGVYLEKERLMVERIQEIVKT